MADHALRGYTCIIFMLRKLTVPGDPSTQPLALDVARQIVGVVSWLLAHCPWPATLTAAFGPFRAYVPFAYVAAHLLRCEDVTAYAADVEALEKATRGVRQITTLEGEFSPLAKAMEGLSADVRKRFNEKSGGMAFGEG